MIKVSDIVKSNDIDNMKQESVYMLSKQKHIQEFLKANGLKPSIINDYWVEFLDFNDDYNQCLNCSGLNQCPKDTVGLKKSLVYLDHNISLELSSCVYGKSFEKRRDIEKLYVIKNISDELLYTDFKSLDIVKGLKEQSVNNINTVRAVINTINTDNSNKGLFVYGIDITKTKLLAGMALELVKKGKKVGFIHFPTYLLDLKASFSSSDSSNTVDKLMKVPYLIIDSIGEENVTAWSRDEILVSVLSYRLLNNLPTYFTSMYTLKELISIYTLNNRDTSDKLRAKTLVSKIKALSEEFMID